MTDHQLYFLVTEAKNISDRDDFVSDCGLSSIWDENADLTQTAELCGKVWDAVNLPFSEIRKKMGLTQAQMAKRLCAPRRTIENWEYRETCPLCTRILIYRVWFGLATQEG